MTSRLESALHLAAMGIPVIPLVTNGKTPAVNGWQDWATTDAEKLRLHWSRNPHHNIGAVTGREFGGGYLVAIDLDQKNGKDGIAALQAMALDAGGDEFETRTHSTPSGRHCFAVSQNPVSNAPIDAKAGIDVRGLGGYVVAPGSTVGGKLYTLEKDLPIAPLPAWLDTLMRSAPKRKAATQEPVAPLDTDDHIARAIHYLTHEAPPAIEGECGDETTYRVAARVKDFGLSESATMELMVEHWNARCSPPWAITKLSEKVSSAYRNGQEPPGAAAPEAVFKEVPQPAAPAAAPTAPIGAVLPFDPRASRIGDVFSTAPDAPRFIVQGLYPVACGQENSVGGLGKTTRRIWEAVHLILGRPLYGYPVNRPGSVVFVTKEDGAEIFRHRIYHVAEALNLTPAERSQIAEHMHVLDLTGDVAARLVAVDRDGNLRPTNLAERIYRGYHGEGVAQVVFDPWNGFSPGERFVNDAEAALMVSGALIARELSCNVCYVGHVSKSVGRQGIIDAHSGRGGAAMGDNARFVMNYVPHAAEDAKEWPAPVDAERAAAQGNLFRLHITKQSYAKRPTEPIWIERQGYAFTVHKGAPSSPEARMAADGERIKEFVRQELERGTRYMRRPLEEQHDRYGMGRNTARQVIGWLMSAGGLVERPLPESERRGKATQFLEPVFKPAPALTGEDPFE